MNYRGHVKGGVVVFDEPVELPEGLEVRVEVMPTGTEQQPTLYDRLQPVIGIAEGVPEDAALNVDHYLYGHPKR